MVATFIIVIGTLVLAHFLKYWSSRVHESHIHSKHDRSPSASRSKSRRRSLSITLPHAVQLHSSRLRLLRGLAYALISGILSAHSLLVAKSAVELLVRTIVDHVNQFNSYQSWLILLALIFFALSQLYYLHLGLRLCSTSVLYPFVFCIYNIIAILDGLIYFHQTSRLSILHACLIALGTVILLSGVLALSWRLEDGPPTEPQPTPLGPGLGLVSSVSEDRSQSPSSPLLPTTRPRSSTAKRRSFNSVNESTPLLHHRQPSGGRRPTFMIYPPPPETGDPRQIWAELDDSNESDRDVLASLPRSISPFLSTSALKSRRKSRGNSLSSANSPNTAAAANGLWGRPGSAGITPSGRSGNGNATESSHPPYKPPRRSQTLKERTHYERRRSSGPSTGNAAGSRSTSASSSSRSSGRKSPSASPAPATSTSDTNLPGRRTESPSQRGPYRDRVRGRPRSATEASQRVVPSRWDMSGSVARWWQGQGQGQGRSQEGLGDRRLGEEG
jgi:magnesium transporter